MNKMTDTRIRRFLQGMNDDHQELRAAALYQDGRVLLNEAYEPYSRKSLHPVYSVTKSLVSIAIGFLVEDGTVDISRPWISYLPRYEKWMADARMKDITVRHLLTMTMGQDAEVPIDGTEPWIRRILAKPLAHEPGTVFFYNSMCTQMLSVLFQDLTGQKTAEFIRRRVFQPLGIRDSFWLEDRQGYSLGGYGLHLRTEDLLKIGVCILNGGRYGNRQVIPAGWLQQATAKQVETKGFLDPSRTENTQGYGYGFWMCTGGAFRCSGMYGQICYIDPGNRLVLAAAGSVSGSLAILRELYRAEAGRRGPASRPPLALPLISGRPDSVYEDLLLGTFRVLDRDVPVRKLAIRRIRRDVIRIELYCGKQEFLAEAAYGRWKKQENRFSDFGQFRTAAGIRPAPAKFKGRLYSNYAWLSRTRLKIQIRTDLDSAGYTFTLDADQKCLAVDYRADRYDTGRKEYAFTAARESLPGGKSI
jgi:CubicO group peptidase (beta-lactamase class C family)